MTRVAGYCRVSTERQDQANSFVAQQRYFREYIARNSDWELFDIYADEGASGTTTYKRFQFNRMMNDARRKCFDLILTKEVSRFSRNILDTIAYTRALKALGIGVIFMNDGLNTMDSDAELRLSIMGSIAQEESRKISERVKWGQTRQMEQGVVFGRSMLGYDVSDGKLILNKEGAEIVKRIFYQYGVEKKSTTMIAKELQEDGIRTTSGNSIWTGSYILKILKNEKYIGDLIQKKTITPDYLSHAKKYNHGEEKMVVIQNHHEPIISRTLWDIVQQEVERRRRAISSKACSNRYPLSGKILCAECGATFVSRTKTRTGGSSYKVWRCQTASKEGREKTDLSGLIRGCDIGKQIPDDLAMSMVKYTISNLKLDWLKLRELVMNLVVAAIYNEKIPDPKLKEKEQVLQKKKIDAIDAYLSNLITKDELLQMKSLYDNELRLLQKQEAHNSDSFVMHKDALVIKMNSLLDLVSHEDIGAKALCKLLEYMKVQRDGTVLIKLNDSDCVWKFKLIKS